MSSLIFRKQIVLFMYLFLHDQYFSYFNRVWMLRERISRNNLPICYYMKLRASESCEDLPNQNFISNPSQISYHINNFVRSSNHDSSATRDERQINYIDSCHKPNLIESMRVNGDDAIRKNSLHTKGLNNTYLPGSLPKEKREILSNRYDYLQQSPSSPPTPFSFPPKAEQVQNSKYLNQYRERHRRSASSSSKSSHSKRSNNVKKYAYKSGRGRSSSATFSFFGTKPKVPYRSIAYDHLATDSLQGTGTDR